MLISSYDLANCVPASGEQSLDVTVWKSVPDEDISSDLEPWVLFQRNEVGRVLVLLGYILRCLSYQIMQAPRLGFTRKCIMQHSRAVR